MRKSILSPFILAVAICSIVLLGVYAIAQTTDTTTQTGDQPVSTDQPADQGTTGAGTGAGTTMDQQQQQPAGTGAGTMDQQQQQQPAGTGAGTEEQPAGAITVPEGQPCPPGTEPAPAQPTAPAGTGAGTEEQPAGAITVPEGQPCPPGYVPSQTQPAAPGAGPMEQPPVTQEQPPMETEAQPSVTTPTAEVQREEMMRQPTMRARPAGYGAGPYYRRGYLPRAGVDFGSLAMLGSTLLGAGLMIRRRR